MPTPCPSDPTPESLFASWLESREGGEETDFDAFCREHAPQAEGLRTLRRKWLALREVMGQAGLGGSLAVELASRYGADVDPRVALGGAESDPDAPSSAVLSRLAERDGASTRYSVQGEVAQGGMGAVLRVWDEDLRRPLAMKVMLGQGAPRALGDTPPVDGRLLARFLEEAQVTGQLDHPGIVPVHELGLDGEGHVYFTMKLVQGRTLLDVFDELARGEGGWTRTRVLGLVLKVCEAMSYAHAKGVIHRDLKPSNVMVGRFGEVYVMDWGLAKVLDGEGGQDVRPQPAPAVPPEGAPVPASTTGPASEVRAGDDRSLVTREGEVVGTPAYMPPEQARGELAAMGPHSDVYAVGAMLYHLLAGHAPYLTPGERRRNHAVWRRVQAGPPPPLEERAPDAPAELVALCAKAMAREPGARYPEMAALAEDLSAYLEGRVVRAYEAGAWAEARKWIGRNRALAASLAAAVLLLVAGLVSSLVLKAQSDAHAERADVKATEALANLALASRNEAEAKAQQRLAEAETAKVLRLSDVKVLQELTAEADELWPTHPERIPALEAWVARAQDLVDNLLEHRATLEGMRERAQPPGAGEESDAWRFDTDEDQWQHDVLAQLVADLETFDRALLAADGITPEHGWSVPRRLAFARELEQSFGPGGEHGRAWDEALPAIRATYPDLAIERLMGAGAPRPGPGDGLLGVCAPDDGPAPRA